MRSTVRILALAFVLVCALALRALAQSPGYVGPGQIPGNYGAGYAAQNWMPAASSCPSWLSAYQLVAITGGAPTSIPIDIWDGTQCVSLGTLNATAHSWTPVGGGGGGGGGGGPALVLPLARLSLTSGVAVTTTDVTGATTIYYVCDGLNQVPYYTGTADATDTIASCNMSLVLEASGTGVENASNVFDAVWWHNGGVPAVCAVTNGSGGGWASDTGGSNTARGTGYSQIDVTTRFYPTNKNTLTHCFNGTTDYGPIAANRATLLGSFYTNGGAGLAEDSALNRVLSNAFDWKPRHLQRAESAVTWNWSTASYHQANANTANQVAVLSTLPGIYIDLDLIEGVVNSTSTPRSMQMGIGLDSTSVNSSTSTGFLTASNNGAVQGTSNFKGYPGVGLHNLIWLEQGNGTDTQTWIGTSSTGTYKAGLDGNVWN